MNNVVPAGALRRLAPLERIMQELGRFGAVGLIALVIDVGLFNLLIVLDPSGGFADKPLTAKAIAVAVATAASFLLNRSWTYSDREQTGHGAQAFVLFVVFNLIGMAITLGCLWFSHYALGLTSPLADNISANVVGLLIGTAFRFWAYRTWVFPAAVEPQPPAAAEPVPAPVPFASDAGSPGAILIDGAAAPLTDGAPIPLMRADTASTGA